MLETVTVSSSEAYKQMIKDKGQFIRDGIMSPVVVQRTAEFQYRVPLDDGISQESINWAKYTLFPMPGCCGIVVYSGARIHGLQRRNGLGQHFFSEAFQLMEETGYSCSVCTVISSMTAQIHILEKNGWSKVHSFINRRTENEVQIWVKNINQPERTKELPVVPRFVEA